MLLWKHFIALMLLVTTLQHGTHAIRNSRGSGNGSSSGNLNGSNKKVEQELSNNNSSTSNNNIATNKSTHKQQTSSNVQSKRDLSLSYTATDIDSKEGARIKTITVIKNHNKDGKSEKLLINPTLHKNENWADAFRDNFDDFGAIPDVPDIDDLFEFMNKKTSKTPTKPKSKEKEKPEIKTKSMPMPTTTHQLSMPTRKQNTDRNGSKKTQTHAIGTAGAGAAAKPSVAAAEKPVIEPSIEMITQPAAAIAMMQHKKLDKTDRSSPSVEKIKGDAELIPFGKTVGGKRQSATKNNNKNAQRSDEVSQSLSLGIMDRLREQLINVNYSTPQHSVHQYFENYVQQATPISAPLQPPRGYDYPRPCINLATSSVSVSTPSGRTYDVPPASSNNANGVNGMNNPYLAPSLAKKPPQQSQLPPLPPQQVAAGNSNQLFPPYTAANPPNQQQQPPQPTYSVNSILPPLQPSPLPNGVQVPQAPPLPILPNNVINVQPTQQPGGSGGGGGSIVGGGYSTSQRPYVAPSLRNGLGFSRGPPPTPAVYGRPTGAPNYRINSYDVGAVGAINKPHYGRSRGLKY